MQALKRWWHNRTYAHYELAKPGVGVVELCAPRWGKKSASALVAPEGLVARIQLWDVSPEDIKLMSTAETPMDLMNVGLDLYSIEHKRQEECDGEDL